MNIFSILFNMRVCCVFLLESPHRGDSYEYTQYTIFNIKTRKCVYETLCPNHMLAPKKGSSQKGVQLKSL